MHKKRDKEMLEAEIEARKEIERKRVMLEQISSKKVSELTSEELEFLKDQQ